MRNIRLKAFILLAASCLLFLPLPAGAVSRSADVRIAVNQKTVHVGEVFTVAVTFTGSGDAIDVLQASLDYDNGRMAYQSGGGNAVELSGGSGGIADTGSETTKTLRYDLRFLALKEGSARFEVTESELIGFESGARLGSPTAAATIKILPQPAASEQPGTSEQPGNAEDDVLEITVDGRTMFISMEMPDVALPGGFEPKQISYGGKDIEAAVHDATDLVLFYLLDETGEGGFYVYGGVDAEPYPFATFSADAVYTLLPTPTAALPEGYVPAALQIDGQAVEAWQQPGGGDFYLVYAINPEGERDYYLYDAAEGTLQRVLTEEGSSPQESDLPSQELDDPPVAVEGAAKPPAAENGDLLFGIWLLAALCLLLAVITVIASLRLAAMKKSKSAGRHARL